MKHKQTPFLFGKGWNLDTQTGCQQNDPKYIYLTVYGKYGRHQKQCNSNRYQTLGPHSVQVNTFSAQGQAYPFRHALGSSVAIPATGAQYVEIVTRISWGHLARDKFSNRPKGPEKDIWSILSSSLNWGLLSTVFLLYVSIETLKATRL